jgi:hypothetical protein
MAKVPVKIFISYAHADGQNFTIFNEALKKYLGQSLYFNFTAWEDSQLNVGFKWHDSIQENLKNADIAILCVSHNFFQSEYIKESEFKNLLSRYTETLIIPVYFNTCEINTWKNLGDIQFFKPRGATYGCPDDTDFSFSSLTQNTHNTDSETNSYCTDLVKHIEQAYINKIEKQNRKERMSRLSNKIVEYVIITAIVLSLVFVVYTFGFNHINDDGKRFNGTVGCAMFFGTSGLFIVNRKFQHN